MFSAKNFATAVYNARAWDSLKFCNKPHAMSYCRALKMMVSKKKVIISYLDRKYVNSNRDMCNGSFNSCFYRFCHFRTASAATAVISN